VGNYLTVHENPVSFRQGFSFSPNHVTTIEPGFYLEGEFGMRIENVYLCKEVEVGLDLFAIANPQTKYEFQGKRYLGFECITRVPIDVRMIDWSLTTKSEIRWVNAHNTMVQDALLPLLEDDLDKDAREWLKRVCKPKIILPWTGA
jgi:Xaa-Pro aminopeptidase